MTANLRLSDVNDVQQAVANSGGAVGTLVGTKINGTGFSRARFIFSFGANPNTASLSSGLGVWDASTSGATFSARNGGSFAAVTSGVLSNVTMIIDAVINAASPWLLISGGSIVSSAIANSCVVELCEPVYRPPTASPQQIVII